MNDSELNLNSRAFEVYVRYGQQLTTDFQHFLRNPEAYNDMVKNRFINFSDEGSAIQNAFQESGRENVLEWLEESQENGHYIREEFEYAENYLNAVTQNLEEIIDARDVPQQVAEPVYEGRDVMLDHYNPREI